MKKPVTAETAETAEKNIPRILGELCVLRGKTPHSFTSSLVLLEVVAQDFSPAGI